MQRRFTWKIIAMLMLTGACGGGDDAPLEPVDASSQCRSDDECSNALYCDGVERCAPADPAADPMGCVGGEAPCEPNLCDESADDCDLECATPDGDGDGHPRPACGGDDCDDDDARRYPGNTEVCDEDDHDEDCDATTFGVRDADGDGFSDLECCNGDACGDDCNDARGAQNPGQAETCDTFDNDCDGMVDEMVQRTFYEDSDGDGYGAADGATSVACVPPLGFVENDTDCDDAEAAANPATTEVCDSAAPFDNDCDGQIDEEGERLYYLDRDADEFGDPDSVVTRFECTPPSGYVARAGDCNDDDASIHATALELCDGIDSDCSLPGDGSSEPLEDADGDGHTQAGVAFCVAGPPSFLADDCDDDPMSGAFSFAGAPELCDGLDNDCDETIDEGATASCGYGATCTMGVCEADTQLAVGDTFGCATHDGSVRCWGRNDAGQLGDSTFAGSLRARPAAAATSLGSVDELEAGVATMCARTAGSVLCWGQGFDGASASATPTAVAGLSDAVQVSVGGSFACARRVGGEVRCWGSNVHGQLGDRTTTSRPSASLAVVLPSAAVEVGAGDEFACARLRSGAVYCWGRGANGQLGNAARMDSSVPVRVATLEVARELGVGRSHACAIDASGLHCWGVESRGQLGRAIVGSGNVASPVAASVSFSTLSSLVVGDDITCVLGDEVACIGRNDARQLGTDLAHPVDGGQAVLTPRVLPLLGAREVAVGRSSVCGMREDGSVACIGLGHEGSLGDGGTQVPRDVVGLDVVQLDAGRAGAIARDATGDVWAWGSMGRSLPEGVAMAPWVEWAPRSSPTRVPGIANAIDVAASSLYQCAVLSNGTVWCWGYPVAASGPATASPSERTGFTAPVIDVELSVSHACAILEDGDVMCWGDNSQGRFDGTGSTRTGRLETSPQPVFGVSEVVQLALGESHTCGRRSDATAVCWGQNRDTGAVGIGAADTIGVGGPGDDVGTFADDGSYTPQVLPLPSVTDVTAGLRHTCAVSDGVVYCWGVNQQGQLGDGTTTQRYAPVATSVTGATRVVAGDYHTCAVLTSGGMRCWGSNLYGTVGRGMTSDAEPVPMAPLGLAGVSGAAAGDSLTCAMHAAGVSCWGRHDGSAGADAAGALGIGLVHDALDLPP